MNVLAVIAILTALAPQSAFMLSTAEREQFVETEEPVLPTEAECEIGWQPGEHRWHRSQLEALCEEDD